jgi:RES domain-containing protein
LSLTIAEQTTLEELIRKRTPISGTYFRSVERRFMDPLQILNGRGTELNGGRFAPIGMRCVYLADTDAGASAEVLARKKRLGNASQITLDKYPRVVFAVDVELERVVSLIRKPGNLALAAIRAASLVDDLSYSQDVGRFLANSGIQGLLFKSLVGAGVNLMAFLENCDSNQLIVRNLDETIDTLKRIMSKRKGSGKG